MAEKEQFFILGGAQQIVLRVFVTLMALTHLTQAVSRLSELPPPLGVASWL